MSPTKDHFKVISIRQLSQESGVNYNKIRESIVLIKPHYSSMTDNEKTQLANTLFKNLTLVFRDLGREISIK